MVQTISRSLLFIVFFAGAPELYGTQFYSIYNFPTTYQGVGCQEQAESIAAQLAQTEGVEVGGAICEYDDLVDRNRIVISYDSPTPLPLVSTYTFHATYDDKGVYASEEQCLAAIPWEEQLFTSQTGIPVFLSFCSRQRLERDRPWYVQVDGFGQSEIVPSRTSWNTNRPYGLAEGELKQDLQRAFQQKGLDLVHLTVRPSATLGKATIFFYGPMQDRGITISGKDILTVPGLTECQAEARSLMDQLAVTDRLEALTAYCASPYSNPNRFEVTVVHWGMSIVDDLQSPQSFETLAECRTAKERIVQQWRGVYGELFLAASCGLPRFTGIRPGQPSYKVIGIRAYR